MKNLIPERTNQVGTVTDSGTDKMDSAVAYEPGCIDCLGKPDFGTIIDDPDSGFMGKLSDKFFNYLRYLAR